jgi:hypothetical protein
MFRPSDRGEYDGHGEKRSTTTGAADTTKNLEKSLPTEFTESAEKHLLKVFAFLRVFRDKSSCSSPRPPSSMLFPARRESFSTRV